jgi:hypothetical protein
LIVVRCYQPPLRRLLAVVVSLVALSCNGGGSSSSAPPMEQPALTPDSSALHLPLKTNSVRFAVIGDAGRGDLAQYQVSATMQAYRRLFPFSFVVMLGDNVYDGGTVADYQQKFELPYKPLLDAGVLFYAAIGNHDDFNQIRYAPFHMGGQRYFTFKPPSVVSRLFGASVRFFVIDTENVSLTQLQWLESEMSASDADWKIPIFHRPLYTSGRYDVGGRYLRSSLEPIFIRHRVAAAFSGHEHFYQRIKPQHGITYFISGGAGSLRVGDLRPSEVTAAGFDRDYHFMLVEINDDELYYQAIARNGGTVDYGVIRLPARASATPTR